MDSLQMEVFSIWCQGQLDLPRTYNHHKTERLTHILRVLNGLYTDSLSTEGLAAGIRQFGDGRIRVDTLRRNGDSCLLEVLVEVPDYLHARLIFTCAGRAVIAQRYELRPGTKVWCSDHHQSFFDFGYCRNVYAPALAFPLHFARNEYFFADKSPTRF